MNQSAHFSFTNAIFNLYLFKHNTLSWEWHNCLRRGTLSGFFVICSSFLLTVTYLIHIVISFAGYTRFGWKGVYLQSFYYILKQACLGIPSHLYLILDDSHAGPPDGKQGWVVESRILSLCVQYIILIMIVISNIIQVLTTTFHLWFKLTQRESLSYLIYPSRVLLRFISTIQSIPSSLILVCGGIQWVVLIMMWIYRDDMVHVMLSFAHDYFWVSSSILKH